VISYVIGCPATTLRWHLLAIPPALAVMAVSSVRTTR
jgi:hypothetical protein